jgi:GNAT superfamily N-acetyltransferase
MLFVDTALARRLELAGAASQAGYTLTHDRLYPHVGAATLAVAGGWAVYTGPGAAIGGVVGLGMSGPVTETDLEMVEQFCRLRGEPVRIDLCPMADGSLRELLSRRGYVLEELTQVLARPVAPGYVAPHPAEGVTVEPADPADGEVWSRTLSRAFAEKDETAPTSPGKPSISLTMFRMAASSCFLARVDKDPAGAGVLEVREGLGLFHSTAVLPDYRRRGAQAALLQARLAAASAAGCDLAVVHTAPGSDSQRNCQRAGFQVAYTKAALVRRWAQ